MEADIGYKFELVSHNVGYSMKEVDKIRSKHCNNATTNPNFPLEAFIIDVVCIDLNMSGICRDFYVSFPRFPDSVRSPSRVINTDLSEMLCGRREIGASKKVFIVTKSLSGF